MCGICGIYRKDDRPVRREEIEEMKEIMRHRGPEDQGIYLGGRVGLGFRRLRIIDLLQGNQPMENEKGSLRLVCNGEIYNYLSLREELQKKGHIFKSHNDVEVILHLYEEEGLDCVKRLRGMFAFVIWDQDRDLIFGARDRFGIKPFYYRDSPEELIFASEMKSILALDRVQREVDRESLVHYLTFQFVPEPDTILEGIKKLPPATYFVLRGNKLDMKKYWELKFSPEDRPLEYFVEGIRENLRESVRLHTQSDVPWGGFLSSGIDSSLIAALLSEIKQVSTFSVGYEEKDYSELQEARETAGYLGTDHHEYVIRPGEFIDNLVSLVWHFDEPVADPSAISLYFVARMARESITVTLSGEGADEVFGGYGIYTGGQSLDYYRKLPRPLQDTLGFVTGLLPEGVPGKNYVRRARTNLEDRYVGNAFIFGDQEKKGLLVGDMPEVSFREVTRRYFTPEVLSSYDEVTQMQYVDFHTWMTGDILAKADKMTMANALELRVPFLDHKVFEFAATIPTRYKVKNKTTKIALRSAFPGLLPPKVNNRPKRGFPVPLRKWMRGELKERLQEIIQDCFTPQFFNYSSVEKLFQQHLEGKGDNSRKLWTIIIFLLWHDIYINRKHGSEPRVRIPGEK